MTMYNAAPYLRECIDSIFAQTFNDFELIIVDDGSTDESVDTVRSYSDPRIRLICREHDFIDSLNTLLDEAHGQYIARMDADDIMLYNRLQVQYDYLEAHPEVAAICSQAVRIDIHGRPIGQIGGGMDIIRITPRMMCETNHVCNPSCMMRRDIIRPGGLHYEREYEYAEDYRFWCRVLSEYGPIDCLPQRLLHYRISDRQVTANHWDDMMRATKQIKSNLIATLVERVNPNYIDPDIKDSECELTLIIPFLNEGEEVENTVKSFREFGGDQMEIMVINDCSYDSYPYMERLTAIPGVTYILNRERLGVAASRDKGVSLCHTPYFLLLDAHMRAYDDSWLTKIPQLLRENDRCILCCQNKPLEKDSSGAIVTDNETATRYGARLIVSRRPPVPGIDWIDEELEPGHTTEAIPAVLGAGYATTPRYWNHIGGLKGLIEYGCDEQLISLKTWLDGGKCLLLKQVVLGHIYRNVMPYKVDSSTPLFNNLLVTETLFPLRERIMARAAAYTADRQRFMTAFSQVRSYLSLNRNMIRSGSSHRERFDNFMRFNVRSTTVERSLKDNIYNRTGEIYQAVVTDMPTETGLFEGITGRAIWLLHYATAKDDSRTRDIAKGLIEQVMNNLPLNDPCFSTGLSGIGWALIYLQKQGLIDLSEHVLSIIDSSIAKMMQNISDSSFESGTAGILAYVCARITTINANDFIVNNQDMFVNMAQNILIDPTDPVAVYYALLWIQLCDCGFENAPSLYLTDWMTPSNFVARDKQFWSMSMRGGVTASSIHFFIKP